ncbi:BRAP2 RING ZnF UBP domain-containing protein 1 [Quercus suber]|uniref:Brca1-associated protein n=1 Tax=Quercus suber TaxID=58331 RepID=A0AAW0M2R5_QUESU|nr:BRCA1-associated protein [Quercus suber]POF23857.1 brca1-associated protein [Quercus suber]
MFFLRVHSLDTDHTLKLEATEFTTATTTPSNPNPNPKFRERRGEAHLFRSTSHSSLPNPSSRSTFLFIVAVPNYLSFDDFIRFCESRIDQVSELLFIRNDGMEDRYSVVIRLENQSMANGFYCNFNGKKFSPGEAEVCHILFVMSVEYTESEEIARTPPAGFTKLPTCPVCLERLDADTSGILSTICDHSFQCPCISKWTYLSCQVCRFCMQQDEKPACFVCETLENIWVCMICGFVGCGRYKKGHAIEHYKDTQHCYSLDMQTQQIWDYVGDNYVHRLNQSKIDSKLAGMSSPCMSLEGSCGTCGCSEDSGISGALFSSKVEAIMDEYNHLLATQLETQRQYYESQIVEAKSKVESSISEAVENAVTSKMQDIQNKLEKFIEEKNAVADINRDLIKNQEIWRKKAKETEEREAALLKSRDEKILDLEEQIRDLTIYMEAQKTLGNMTDTDGIRDGTLLPLSYKQSSPANSRRHTKAGRRR